MKQLFLIRIDLNWISSESTLFQQRQQHCLAHRQSATAAGAQSLQHIDTTMLLDVVFCGVVYLLSLTPILHTAPVVIGLIQQLIGDYIMYYLLTTFHISNGDVTTHQSLFHTREEALEMVAYLDFDDYTLDTISDEDPILDDIFIDDNILKTTSHIDDHKTFYRHHSSR